MSVVPAWPIWRAPLCFLAAIAIATNASGQATDQTVELALRAGRSMRVALDHRVMVHRVGQPIMGTLVEPVYVYDRIVLPIGTRVTGHIERIDRPSKKRR